MNEFLSVKQAAQRKQVTESAVYKAINAGRLHATRVLGRFALMPADVDACDFGSYAGVKRTSIPRGPNRKKEAASSEDAEI